MNKKSTLQILLTVSVLFLVYGLSQTQEGNMYKIHDMNWPQPKVIDPGTPSIQEKAGQPPSDAIVLFDGKDLSQWCSTNGEPAKWKVKDGYLETVGGVGAVRTVRNFGDCQLHLEFATPTSPEGKSQGRGNSGIFLMSKYEVQVLDSYENQTYPDGQAASIYGQYPPQVNASRPPGQWQTYDIIFHGPRFGRAGELLLPAAITVFHNGVLVQDNVEIEGPTSWLSAMPYNPHRDRLPLMLQDHANPVRYRNIWIRELPAAYEPYAKEITIPASEAGQYVGRYKRSDDHVIRILMDNLQLSAELHESQEATTYYLFHESEGNFYAKGIDVKIVFHKNSSAIVDSLTLYMADSTMPAKKID